MSKSKNTSNPPRQAPVADPAAALTRAIENKHGDFIRHLEKVRDLGADIVGKFRGGERPVHEQLPILFLARAVQCLHSIETLFLAGQETDAQTLMRTIAELRIDLRYILAYPGTRLQRYYDYASIFNQKRARSMQAVLPHMTPEKQADSLFEARRGVLMEGINSGADLLKESERLRAEAVAKWNYGSNWAETKGGPRVNIYERAKAVDLESDYELIHTGGSVTSHASLGSLNHVIQYTPEGMKIYVGPAMPLNDFVVVMTAVLVLNIAGDANDYLGLGRGDEIKQLDREFLSLCNVEPPAGEAASAGGG